MAVERSEVISPEPAAALAGLLDVPLPDFEAGDGLPLTWHWLYLLERPLQRDLGPDGHPWRNALPDPPGPGLRRMWAGGQILCRSPLRVGEQATRSSRLLSTAKKTGASGVLTFLTVGHTITQGGRVVIEERQDILYRDPQSSPGALPTQDAPTALPGEARPPGEALPPEEAGAPGEWSVPVSPTLLFRFSALTYNGHRIHYDRDFARTEGYPGLVVHGPLQAMAMAEAARSHGLTPREGVAFDYRLVAPLFDEQGLVAAATQDDTGVRTSVRDVSGRRTAEGRLSHT